MKRDLSHRERQFLAIGGLALAILIVIAGVVLPYQAAMSRMDSDAESLRKQLQEVERLQAEYLELKKHINRLQKDLRSGRAAPLTFLEETAVNIAGRESLVLMRPLPAVAQGAVQIEPIEFKMERIDLEEALLILQAMDAARPPIRVDKLYIKQRFDDGSKLNMNVTASSVGRD